MPKTVTLSDDDLAALRILRSIAADTAHPARPAAVALIDRIAAAPEVGPRFPVVTRSGALPLDLSQPDGHRSSMLHWDNTLGDPRADIAILPGQDLHLALMRPNDAVLMKFAPVELRLPIGAGAEHRRAMYRLDCALNTRPAR